MVIVPAALSNLTSIGAFYDALESVASPRASLQESALPLVRPFAALRPASAHAAEVASPPYDVLSTEEARARAAGKPWSFLHVSKPEIDFPAGTDSHSEPVYARARENLARMVDAGVLVRDGAPAYYVYRLTAGELVQTGVAVAASVAAYESNRVRRHELTRPDKEDDRVRHMEALNAQTGPVLAAYPQARALDSILAEAAHAAPACDVVADGTVRHAVWPIRDAATIARIGAEFDAMPAIYIADGHHRSAAAARVAARRGGSAEASHNWFLVVAFPHHDLCILDYNRVVRDLNGMSVDEFLARLREKFAVAPSDAPVRPARHGEFGLYAAGKWHRLVLRPDLADVADPVGRLDMSLLTAHVLEPILAIGDQRTDRRIDFVGGGRGLRELEKRVDAGEMAAAFALYPTRLEDLMAVADAGEVMPPKSTWFEPKLADGLLSHVLD
jgi:uncharacterized protein (DUF1015 family)